MSIACQHLFFAILNYMMRKRWDITLTIVNTNPTTTWLYNILQWLDIAFQQLDKHTEYDVLTNMSLLLINVISYLHIGWQVDWCSLIFDRCHLKNYKSIGNALFPEKTWKVSQGLEITTEELEFLYLLR